MVFSAVQNSDLLNCLVSDQILQIKSAFIDLNNIVMASLTPLGYDIKTNRAQILKLLSHFYIVPFRALSILSFTDGA